MTEANSIMSNNAKGSIEYKWAENEFNTAKSLATLGGATFVASYVIHISSLGSLRKYALKKRYEEIK